MEPFPSISFVLHCDEDAEEAASSGDFGGCPTPPLLSPPCLSASSFYDDAHCPVADLLSAELQHGTPPSYLARLRDGSLDATTRMGVINWILKAQAFHRLRPMTGFLAVNYLDRFLSSKELPKGVGWPWQLLAVACLSVAAKMEETDPPPLLDLQVLELSFVFDPRTVARMELLLMAALHWRMRPITPFDFVGHFVGLLCPSATSRREMGMTFSRIYELLLGTQRVVDFLRYSPSEIAAAAVLSMSGANEGANDLCSLLPDAVSKVSGETPLFPECSPSGARRVSQIRTFPGRIQ